MKGMANRNGKGKPIQKVWFFTSELENERAGSFRQERWGKVFLGLGARISIFNVMGSLHLREAHFEDETSFLAFRAEALKQAKLMASVREGAAIKLLRRIKHIALIDFYLPNIIMLFFKALPQLMGSRGRVLIMCSSPPFSLALVGGLLKTLFPSRIKLFVDMRDAWAMHTALGGIKGLKRFIEGTVLRKADHVSTVSHGLRQEFEKTHRIKVQVLYNVATHYFSGHGVAMDLAELDPRIRRNALKLVYTGSTPEGFYDLPTIVGGVAAFRAEHPELAEALQLIFVGACQEVAFEVARHKGRIGDAIITAPHVSHATAKAIQNSADILTFLAYPGEGNMGVVSTKFFEYLALGKPVFPLTIVAESDVDLLLRRYAGGSLNLLTPEDISRQLHQIAAHGAQSLPRCQDGERLKELFNAYIQFASSIFPVDEQC
jgi:glycosyltransferase involved in cell wall biosynthesis